VSRAGGSLGVGRDPDAPRLQSTVSGSHGVQAGEYGIQVNSYFFGGDAGPGRSAEPFKGPPAARLLGEVTDPFALEVHRSVRAQQRQRGLPLLPAYLPRGHDAELAEVVQAAADGMSGIAVLVGGPSTGKTRSCWEVLELLRGRPEGWRLWHPIAPSRPEAALQGLPSVGPRTVVWLNEAQFYLSTSRLGERVAAGLRELLRDSGPCAGPGAGHAVARVLESAHRPPPGG
jgi:hypothetical protein